MSPDPLQGLKDIHLPPPVPWWPPAPGWWLLAATALLALAGGLAWWRRYRRRHAPRRAALHELDRLLTAYRESGDSASYAAGVSALLRRVALLHYPRERVAALHGEDWVRFLEASGGGFTEAEGRALADAPYRPVATLDGEALAHRVRDWIRRRHGREAAT